MHRRPDRNEEWFRIINRKLDRLLGQGVENMATLAELEVEVRETADVQGSVVVLLRGLRQLLEEAIATQDPAKIQELLGMLDTSTNMLAAAAAEPGPGGGG